jgi:electron transport complex protein RnfD
MALAPPVVAGLILFRLSALEMLTVAVAMALAGHLAARLTRLPVTRGLLPSSVIGVALVGPGAQLVWAAAVAALAATGELARARFVPRARVEVGIVAFALVLLVSWGGAAAYVAPGGTTPTPEPIRLWLSSTGAGQPSIDPVRLYVGNVPGPVFATSTLAVILGAAWLWYARRLSLLVVLTFLTGALASVEVFGWSAGYQLLSGPLWFVAALVLADRETLPTSPVGRPLLGLAAGGLALAMRSRGVAVEGAVLTVGALQLLVAGGHGARWLLVHRREVRSRMREPRRDLPSARTT